MFQILALSILCLVFSYTTIFALEYTYAVNFKIITTWYHRDVLEYVPLYSPVFCNATCISFDNSIWLNVLWILHKLDRVAKKKIKELYTS